MGRQFDTKISTRLLELMIALLTIGIMAACNSNPAGQNIPTEIKQLEAKEMLRQIYAMEQAYHQEHDFYWPNGPSAHASSSYPIGLETLGITIPYTSRYEYIVTGGFTTFTAEARSSILDEDATYDVWSITETGQLVVLSDDAAD